MGFRFRKSIKILPGVKINLSKKGISSVSIGRPGATVNIKSDGTKRATIGIPGTGISYQTRLDKPISKKMTECPYCGHRMRKQWDACPKCHHALVETVEQPTTTDVASLPVKGDTLEEQIANLTPEQREYYKEKGKQYAKAKLESIVPKVAAGLIVLIAFIYVMSGGSTSSTTEDASSPPPQQTETQQPQPEPSSVTTVPAPTTPAVTPEPAPVATAAVAPQRQGNGPGPNGETIKGNINSKGEKIYHVPGGASYNRTQPERWFFTEEDAQAAGFRRAKR